MTCHCGKRGISERNLCEEHFCQWLEDAVYKTIDEFDMLLPGERVLVAASGGKDSVTLLAVLKKRGVDVTAYCVDEGIAGYRDQTIADLKRFCETHTIPLIIESYEQKKGSTLDALQLTHACGTCGPWRRELISDAAKGFDVVATGHNLDDEAETILLNVFKNHAFTPQPVLKGNKTFTKKIKPLYFLPQADIKRYAYLNRFVTDFTECPNAAASNRWRMRDFLDGQEAKAPGSKERLVRRYVQGLTARSS